ncbi:SDR family NAD(P)-dependent oxidoreductase [Herbaspirillum chlorophenolicum]|jgi:short-subunit dehydrogenase|uniref:SDR family NAD(P)-dependent oxidoreductase n=1 Tax=Herbaspirillum chlorophenolicum TaxID=211589 RepID=A0ABW8EXB1_9BURK|nr:SDR family oxidoreductase [Herbaspirillum chlorophenolicum]
MNTSKRQGKALITGASTGIGATYADRLAARGYDLVLVARDAARLEQVAATLRGKHGVQVEVLPADLTSKPELLKVEQRLRGDADISLLLNNAGMAVQGKLIDADIDRYEAMIQLNVVSVTRLAAAAAANFGKRGSGAIINVASVLALAPEMFNGTYSGTKAYVLNLTQSMQQELGPLGVKVQAVLPGATRTEIWERSGGSVDQLPPEMLMEADDMVDAALAGFDQGEAITIPSLPDVADWNALTSARHALGPNLSRNRPAARYLDHAG